MHFLPKFVDPEDPWGKRFRKGYITAHYLTRLQYVNLQHEINKFKSMEMKVHPESIQNNNIHVIKYCKLNIDHDGYPFRKKKKINN